MSSIFLKLLLVLFCVVWYDKNGGECMTTGQLIKAARKRAGMTQAELANKLGIPYQSISQWERDTRNPKYDTLKRIAAALSVDWMELVPDGFQGQVIADHMTELIENVASSGKVSVHKMTDAELFRAGILQFHSEEDRIVHFYNQLTDEGRIAAGGCFFRHLDKDTMSEVADYVMNLSENPLYQRSTAPQSPPPSADGTDMEGSETPE